MKKRRFLLSLCLLSGIILSGFAQAINSSCDGGFIFVTNIDDWNQAQEDFDNNCCAGSSITIYNVTNNTVLEMEAQFDGPNSSCSPE